MGGNGQKENNKRAIAKSKDIKRQQRKKGRCKASAKEAQRSPCSMRCACMQTCAVHMRLIVHSCFYFSNDAVFGSNHSLFFLFFPPFYARLCGFFLLLLLLLLLLLFVGSVLFVVLYDCCCSSFAAYSSLYSPPSAAPDEGQRRRIKLPLLQHVAEPRARLRRRLEHARRPRRPRQRAEDALHHGLHFLQQRRRHAPPRTRLTKTKKTKKNKKKKKKKTKKKKTNDSFSHFQAALWPWKAAVCAGRPCRREPWRRAAAAAIVTAPCRYSRAQGVRRVCHAQRPAAASRLRACRSWGTMAKQKKRRKRVFHALMMGCTLCCCWCCCSSSLCFFFLSCRSPPPKLCFLLTFLSSLCARCLALTEQPSAAAAGRGQRPRSAGTSV